MTVSVGSLFMHAVWNLDVTYFQKGCKLVWNVPNATLISMVFIIVHVHIGQRTECPHWRHAADATMNAHFPGIGKVQIHCIPGHSAWIGWKCVPHFSFTDMCYTLHAYLQSVWQTIPGDVVSVYLLRMWNACALMQVMCLRMPSGPKRCCVVTP